MLLAVATPHAHDGASQRGNRKASFPVPNRIQTIPARRGRQAPSTITNGSTQDWKLMTIRQIDSARSPPARADEPAAADRRLSSCSPGHAVPRLRPWGDLFAVSWMAVSKYPMATGGARDHGPWRLCRIDVDDRRDVCSADTPLRCCWRGWICARPPSNWGIGGRCRRPPECFAGRSCC